MNFSLNYIDYELYSPTSLDQRRNECDPPDSYHLNVPLIRIFGRTDAGQNICAFVHGVFPYMYIEYNGQTPDTDCLRLHQNINAVLASSYRRNPHDDGSTFVADISICKATPFYGLHAGWTLYYKISLLSPKHMTRLADLFRTGQILGRAYQPYESHVPYLLQFMIDYNLYGCASVNCSRVDFRHPLPKRSAKFRDDSSDSQRGELDCDNIPKDRILDKLEFPKQSHSVLEIDVAAGAILNRKKLKQRAIHCDLNESTKIPSDTDRLLPSLTELWEDDARRREALGLTPSRSQLPKSNVRERSNVWSNEEELRKQLQTILEAPFDPTSPTESSHPTSFESIQQFCDRQDKLQQSLEHRPISIPTSFTSCSPSDVHLNITLSNIFRPLRLRGGYQLDPPPSRQSLATTRLEVVGSTFPEPFYSDPIDVPALARDYAANGVMPKSHDPSHLIPFIEDGPMPNARIYSYATPPPKLLTFIPSPKLTSQIAMPTQAPVADRQPRKISEADVPLSVLSLEIHAQSRGHLLPNPAEDPLICIFWAFQDFALEAPVRRGCFVSTQHVPCTLKHVTLVDSEIELINDFIELVRSLDPDAVLSFEMQNSSIGFIEERAKLAFGFSVQAELGRIIGQKDEGHDRWGETQATSVKISGRHVLNLWRIMRSEMNLLQYTLENVCYHLLRLRIPKYSHTDLQRWLTTSSQRVIDYYTHRTSLNLEIIEAQGLLSRVSEQARLLGIDFYSVFSRGSQFKVESLMCRIAKPECYMMMSPSRKQVAQQNALECLPLVMEPQSRFYHDPVLVLDFQSLYPSIMIAYNFCYSTCLGKLGYHGLESKLGVTHYTPDPTTMHEVKDDIEIAPNGLLYVRDKRRKSLLAKMLHDLLETRAMVKEGMKLCKNDRAAQKLMHNRQLALKLIANVTYGYTSASFSGRMPCSEIADSIVQTGRETLEKAIEFIHNHASWNAEVVYGDTDSLFVKLPGRSKAEAFTLGAQIAAEITKQSPSPIKLKFEKVYLPCVLLAKKRYVGFKYEHVNDQPTFDAKGIETVRRDGTPAEQKIEEQALKIMFRTGDLSAVKDFFQRECWKIMTGRCSLHDFCFAKEVKLGTYSTKGVPPPGAVISAKSIAADPRSEPQYGERVSYLVISGPARSRLTDRCVPPEELLLNSDLRLDVDYYITKNIVPPLDRIFCLMGVNVRSWYDEMPRYLKVQRVKSTRMIDTFLTSSHCPVCQQEQPKPGMCADCSSRPDDTMYDLTYASRTAERTHARVLAICATCCKVPKYAEIACVSKDCPIYYKRIKSGREASAIIADSRFLAQSLNAPHDLV